MRVVEIYDIMSFNRKLFFWLMNITNSMVCFLDDKLKKNLIYVQQGFVRPSQPVDLAKAIALSVSCTTRVPIYTICR